MKGLLHTSAVVALLSTIVVPNAISQDAATGDSRPVRVERITPQGNFVQFVADADTVRFSGRRRFKTLAGVPIATSGVRVFRPLSGTNPTRPQFLPGSIVHFEGNVEITIFNRALMLHTSTRDDLTKEMVLTADEADYNVDTGEIQPQGHVSIKFQNVESGPK